MLADQILRKSFWFDCIRILINWFCLEVNFGHFWHVHNFNRSTGKFYFLNMKQASNITRQKKIPLQNSKEKIFDLAYLKKFFQVLVRKNRWARIRYRSVMVLRSWKLKCFYKIGYLNNILWKKFFSINNWRIISKIQKFKRNCLRNLMYLKNSI